MVSGKNDTARVAPSVRIRAVAVLICVSNRDGRLCGEVERFEHDEPEGALALARGAGWAFRLGAARCRRCGNEANSFGKAGGPWHRGTE